MKVSQTISSPSLLVPVSAVAEMLSMGERTVWRLAGTGEIPRPIKIGRSRRWNRRVIEDWVRSKGIEQRTK